MRLELDEFEFTKRIAYFIAYICEELRAEKQSLSEKDVARLFNSQGVAKFSVKHQKINEIRNAKHVIPTGQHEKWWASVNAIIKTHKLNINLRDEIHSKIEEQYMDDMAPAYRQSSSIQQGEALGEMANTLRGAWHFFYLSPINRKNVIAPEIRGTVAIFERAGTERHYCRLKVISGHSLWKGAAFINDSHLYLSCTTGQQIETAFFVTNKPDRRLFVIAGTGAALERHKQQSKVPAAAAFVCFGIKWSNHNGFDKQRSPTETAAVEKALSDFDDGESFSKQTEDLLRKFFCAKVSWNDLEIRYPELKSYVGALEINGKVGLTSDTWIYVDPNPH